MATWLKASRQISEIDLSSWYGFGNFHICTSCASKEAVFLLVQPRKIAPRAFAHFANLNSSNGGNQLSGLKVLVTTTTTEDIEVARRYMGGHGYSAFAGLGRLYADYVPSAT